MTGSYLDALRAELVAYERHGKTARAEQVRAEIARVTGAAQVRAAATPDRTVAPRQRRPRGKATA